MESSRLDVRVALYGRNATGGEAWFAVQPIGDALSSVGFGRDMGVACWVVPAGSQIVMIDGSPGRGPTNVIRLIAAVDGQESDRQELWVDLARDGAVTTGAGVPPWWSGGGPC